VEKIIREFIGPKTEFDFDNYLRSRNIRQITSLNQMQRKQFIEDLVNRVVRPATSSGKTSIARVELMSILKVGVEPWKITADYVPSPREYLLAAEMKAEFHRLRNKTVYEQFVKYKITDPKTVGPETQRELVKTIVGDIFGSMSKTTLGYSQLLFKHQPTEWVVKSNLSVYMDEKEAAESGKSIVSLINTLGAETQKQHVEVDRDVLSEKLRDDFVDTNQVVIRKLKNDLDIKDMGALSEAKKQAIMRGIMSYYFGKMSEQYLNIELEKMSTAYRENLDSAEKLRLINAIIYDCLHSTMNQKDAKAAHAEITQMMNPKNG